jgi:hypothetical protein
VITGSGAQGADGESAQPCALAGLAGRRSLSEPILACVSPADFVGEFPVCVTPLTDALTNRAVRLSDQPVVRAAGALRLDNGSNAGVVPYVYHRPPPPERPPGPPRPSRGGRASSTVIVLSPSVFPLSSVIACRASASVDISTKPNLDGARLLEQSLELGIRRFEREAPYIQLATHGRLRSSPCDLKSIRRSRRRRRAASDGARRAGCGPDCCAACPEARTRRYP